MLEGAEAMSFGILFPQLDVLSFDPSVGYPEPYLRGMVGTKLCILEHQLALLRSLT